MNSNTVLFAKKSETLNLAISPELKRQIEEFGEKHSMNTSTAARFIMASFFEGDLIKNQSKSIKNQGNSKDKGG